MNQRWTKGRETGNPPDKSRDRQKYPKFGCFQNPKFVGIT